MGRLSTERLEWKRAYSLKNQDRLREQRAKWRESNLDKVRAYDRWYQRNMRIRGPSYRKRSKDDGLLRSSIVRFVKQKQQKGEVAIWVNSKDLEAARRILSSKGLLKL